MNRIIFELRLALKKLWINRRRTLGRSVFFGLVFALIFTNLLFLAGSDSQMLRAIRSIKGDASCQARTDGGETADISTAALNIRTRHKGQLSDMQAMFVTQVLLESERAMAGALCHGTDASFYSYLAKVVSWREGVLPPGQNPSAAGYGGIYLEASVADSVFARTGDMITVKYSQEQSGRANSIQLQVQGVFVGSGLLFKGQAFIDLRDMQQLILEENAINELRLYFGSPDQDAMRTVLRSVNSDWGETVSIESFTLDPSGGVFGVYKYYNILLGFVLWSLTLIFFVIMNYSNQNVFFMEYRRRRAETATFLTYGMSPGSLRVVVAWEALLQTATALALSSALTWGITALAGRFEVRSLDYADLITAIGGTHINFAFDPAFIFPAALAMTLIMLWSALKGANRYLNREIREILGTTE